jgi:hypothetical protein
MPQAQQGRRRKLASSPQPPGRYKTVAITPDTYDKVVRWADYLREKHGYMTIGGTIDWLVDNAGVPPEEA